MPMRPVEPRVPFSGSYRPTDVRFLLTPIVMDDIEIAEKERLIQTGQRHYSELLSRETLPSPRYLALFHQVFAITKGRMAQRLLDLAAIIAAQRTDTITLVSLARAGTPIGVLLKHILTDSFVRSVAHYSISIIRDRGIDENALRYILQNERHPAESILFVDGWTGKGVIARELAASVTAFNRQHHITLDTRLFALNDLAGVGVAPSDADDLIPSGILNATLSGLVSRSILNDQIGSDDFHGCVFYREFLPQDLSVWFIEALLAEVGDCLSQGYVPCPTPVAPNRERLPRLLAMLRTRFGALDENHIKPGIGEATRVLLRRVPRLLILRDPDAPESAHLLQLAAEKQVPWEADPCLPYQAVSLIKGLSDA